MAKATDKPITEWSLELERRLQYVEKCYDDVRMRGLDALKLLLGSVTIIAGVPIVFYENIQKIFSGSVRLIYISWILILLCLVGGFIIQLFIFEGYYHRAHRECERWLVSNSTKIAKHEKASNIFFDCAHWFTFIIVILFLSSIGFVSRAIFTVVKAKQ